MCENINQIANLTKIHAYEQLLLIKLGKINQEQHTVQLIQNIVNDYIYIQAYII